MRVLLIEDDTAMARGIELMLMSEGFDVYVADLGEDGLKLGKLYEHDVIILDLQLPDMPGLDVLSALRAGGIHTPVLVLSGNGQIEARIKALKIGADDYMTKPFYKSELVARIHAVVRRVRIRPSSLVVTGRLIVDLDAQTVEACGKKVKLTIKEYEMLELLCIKKGAVVAKDAFLTRLYSGLNPPELKIIDVFICKLRKKLAAAMNGEHYITTIWARGYVLCDPSADAGDEDRQLAIHGDSNDDNRHRAA